MDGFRPSNRIDLRQPCPSTRGRASIFGLTWILERSAGFAKRTIARLPKIEASAMQSLHTYTLIVEVFEPWIAKGHEGTNDNGRC